MTESVYQVFDGPNHRFEIWQKYVDEIIGNLQTEI